MAPPRKIDERDVDGLLAALTDRQIADLFKMTESDVSELRISRQPKIPSIRPKNKGEDKGKP